MLADMTATELGDWYTYFGVTPFTYQLIDLEFAALSNTVVSLVGGSKDLSLNDFLLLKHSEETGEADDSLLMTAGEGIAGGVRYEPADS
ncbi:phage tail assembly protein T [Morganella morganii]|uniref:phage tail assembly protein T n=1 Tax=Morganella morganii TaxID=582 RepID=UPI003EB8CC99